MKFYLPTLKHLVIQLAKLQIYTLNLTTTFWHCKKNPITFEQECTSKLFICPLNQFDSGFVDNLLKSFFVNEDSLTVAEFHSNKRDVIR